MEETALSRSMVASRAACVEKLAARRAVKAVEGRIIGIDGGAVGPQKGFRCVDVGGRGWGGGG